MNFKTSPHMLVIAGLLCSLLPTVAGATPPTESPRVQHASSTKAEEQLTLSLENAEVNDLVRWASHYTAKNIIVHPDVKGRVTVVAGAPISKEDAFKVFKSVLQVHGYALVETAEAIKVVPEAAAAQSNLPVDGQKKVDLTDDMVIRIVKLKNIAAPQLVTLVRPLVPQSATINAYPESNLLLIADRASNISKLQNIINGVDQAGTLQIDVVPLRHAKASELLSTVNGAISGSGKGQTDGNKGIGVTADARTNSLLVTGHGATTQQIRALIQRLDRPTPSASQTAVYRISFGEVKSLVPLLQSAANSALSGTQNEKGSTAIKLEASEEHNAIVVTGPPEVQEAVAAVLETLDVRRPQVLVEALIVEVSDDMAKELGVKWLTNRPDEGGFAGLSALQGNAKDLSSQDSPLPIGTGLTLGFYSSDELRGLIRALETDTSANILSRPTIVAQDNEQAEILVGENVPFVTGALSSASTPATNPFQTIERQDIGVTLKVKPRVNRDDSIALEVEQKAESIAPSRADAADIITSKRSVKTRVIVDDDKVLVLGGLIRDELNVQQSRVPFLSKLPMIGELFKGTSNTAGKKNLMVFIHPRILADSADNDAVTTPRYNTIRAQQEDFEETTDSFLLPIDPPELPPLSSGTIEEPAP